MKKHFENTKNPFLRGLKFFGIVILGAAAAAGFAFIFGYFVMLLWNWLMPEIFGLVAINFWQAAGIVLLARLIFGGFKHGGGDDKCKPSKKKNSFKGEFMKEFKKEFRDEFNKEYTKCGDHNVKDWKHFEEYWWDEGEKQYNDYVERKNEQEQK